MPKNTAIVVVVLAILAALVIGVNIGRPRSSINNQTIVPTPSPAGRTVWQTYKNTDCGLSLQQPETMNVLEGPNGSVFFTSKTSPTNVIAVVCQKDILRPALAADKIEKLTSGSVSAILYHDVSAKDGSPIDKLIFKNPNNNLDIFISGYGPDFQEMIGNIELLK